MGRRFDFYKAKPQQYQILEALADDINSAIGNDGIALILSDNNIALSHNQSVTLYDYTVSDNEELLIQINDIFDAKRHKWEEKFKNLAPALHGIAFIKHCNYKVACVEVTYVDASGVDDKERFAYTEAGYNAYIQMIGQVSVREARREIYCMEQK